ncbi:DUF4262 domain-containing protein [Mycolicibacterium sp. 050158]|uniref:DUF4262 domain-containing protein n=1 Tax=Mycolicibacterium sp. 050158 TaxID=3090602 RepID=UPI00299F4D22|nr:DUF4262 domain-containing protein [Mycolicibacterium sp. 050158]MDX1889492.1 DUF4262 domain-containing protein [Mycolicibacterium sp. 050158]
MCWQCDHPEEALDDYLDLLRGKILLRGWIVQCVEDDRHPFAYTIGLHAQGWPELLVTGLAPKRARWLLNTFAKRTRSDLEPVAGQQVRLPAGTRLELVEVAHPDAHMGMAIAIEGSGISAMQLVWADDRGRWPWAPNFDDGHRLQPVLGVRGRPG